MGGNDLPAAYGDAAAARRVMPTVVENGRRVLTGFRNLMGPDPPIVVATAYDPMDGSVTPARPAALAGRAGPARRAEPGLVGACGSPRSARRRRPPPLSRHGLAAGDPPTQPAARPPDRDLWYCGLIGPNPWGASEVRAAFWEAVALADINWS
jgi:hypothetical protein